MSNEDKHTRGPYRKYLKAGNASHVPGPTLRRWESDVQQRGDEERPVLGDNDRRRHEPDLASTSRPQEQNFEEHSTWNACDQYRDSDDEMQSSSSERSGDDSFARSGIDEEKTSDDGSSAMSDAENSASNFESYASDADSDDTEVSWRSIHSNFEEEAPPLQQLPRLYEGCSLSVEESEMLIMAYALRFGLSDLAIEHLIQLIDCHLPYQVHRSLYCFSKKFPDPPMTTTHYYCLNNQCQELLQFENNETSVTCHCGVKNDLKTCKSSSNYFVTMPLKAQLISLLQNKEICDQLSWDGEKTDDIQSGQVYKSLVEKGVLSKGRDLSIQWNTDGVKIFKSSVAGSLWPIQVCLNELPYSVRRDNMFLCGLWYGRDKPNMDIFLKAFVEDLNELHETGIECVLPGNTEPIISRVHCICSPVDSQARPSLQKIKTYRGRQGCSFCLIEGEECEVGRGHARIYRGSVGKLRTHKQHLRDAKKVEDTGQVVNGIKGYSILLTLRVFSIISSFPVEYMHCFLLGVVKTFAEYWQKTPISDSNFRLGNAPNIRKFDEIFLKFQPPTEITRPPKSISKTAEWKASEWRSFLLYYSLFCLSLMGMPKAFLDHWFLLVYSTYIFLQEKITDSDFAKAERALQKFVSNVERLYGAPELMKFNVHLLLHAPKSRRDFGALWAGSSAFPFEHNNGILAKLFKSSRAVPEQICKNYFRMHSLRGKAAEYQETSPFSPAGKALFDKLMVVKKSSSATLKCGKDVRFASVPLPSRISLTAVHKFVVEELLNEAVIDQNVLSYQRLWVNNMHLHVDSYNRLEKRNNSCVQMDDKSFLMITHALVVTTVANRNVCVLLGLRLTPTGETLCRDRELGITSSDLFMMPVKKTSECVAALPTNVSRKTVFLQHENQMYVVPLANFIERD